MPSAITSLLGVALAALLATGCQNQQGAAANPFASADRVPPPATRIPSSPAPQPYYQGADDDVAPPATFVAAPTAQQLQPTQRASTPPATFAAGESAIGLPTDNQPLRLGTPAQQSAPAQVGASAQLAAASSPPAMAPAAMQAQQPPTSPDFSPVTPPVSLAWGAGSPPPATYAASPAAVTPPPADPAMAYQPAPRVRLPGYATPVSYQAPVGQAPTSQPAAGPIGTVQITELPTPHYQQPAPTNAAATGDGFQPRGASPRSTPTPVTPSVF
ncbi:hypothetical protein Pla123a_27100 [Posidoniimonas polymericola]|uniref:IgA FC receptor n=1 Tax=Posidoniimonas polymericola TaxID=2528002 RepID=A0A5C5YM48_9BACT|nr:hypothetical protein [Posidoniimonas polymericola]TWT75925.1 hypothetical protein Pla123a_27100 [Posidoniimonas polymericola]